MVGDLGMDLTSTDDAVNVYIVECIDVQGNVRDSIVAHSSTIDQLIVSGDVAPTSPNYRSTTISAVLEVGQVQIGGRFGSSTHPQSFQYGDVLKRLTAGSIHGEIYSNRMAAATPTIWRVETTDGPFVGSLECEKLLTSGANPAGIVVSGGSTPANGVLDADVTIVTEGSEDISATGGLASGRTILIAGSYTDDLDFTASNGLAGQVIINSTSSSGSWSTGTFYVGGSAVSGTIPYYAGTGLGGGAVGLVPFHMHGSDCYPPNDATIPTPVSSSVLYYRFYGPVRQSNASSSNPPITIERATIGGSTWTDITSQFAVTVSGRAVEIRTATGWLANGYKYRVSPANSDNWLLCDVPGLANPPVVDSGTVLNFNVESGVAQGCEVDCD